MTSAITRRPMLATARWALQGQSFHRIHKGSLSALHSAVVLTWKEEVHNTRIPALVNVRFFTAAPDPKEKEENQEGSIISRTFKSVLTPQNQFYALVAGGSVGAYFISRVFLGFTNFFTHLTPTVIAKWGFYTGFGCATCEFEFGTCYCTCGNKTFKFEETLTRDLLSY